MKVDDAYRAFSMVATLDLTEEVEGFVIMAFKPLRTAGVFLTILLFAEVPALPAAAARTDL